MWLAYFKAVGREVTGLVVEALQAGGVWLPKSGVEQTYSPSHTLAAPPP